MKKLSRWMPDAPSNTTTPYAFLILIAFSPLIIGAIFMSLLFWPIIWLATLKQSKRMSQLRKDRLGDNICNFAREFDTNKIDTWIIRAVYEELSQYLQCRGIPLAIHADDKWKEDLLIDAEDMNLDLLPDIAYRAQRSLDDTKSNPYYDKVETVREIVLFLQKQPALK